MPRPPRRAPRRRHLLQALLWLPLAGGLGSVAPGRARAQGQGQGQTHGVELSTVALRRQDGQLQLDFSARLTLSRTVEDALLRGVPLYFVAEAALYRRRWYWADRRVARVRRTWRLAFQPLTATWRVSLGALAQSFATLPEALAALSTAGGWKIADLSEVDPDATHYVEFDYRLDATQLPSPMQIGIGGQADWVLRAQSELPLP